MLLTKTRMLRRSTPKDRAKRRAGRRKGVVIESAEGVRFAYTSTQTRPPTKKV